MTDYDRSLAPSTVEAIGEAFRQIDLFRAEKVGDYHRAIAALAIQAALDEGGVLLSDRRY